MKPKTLHREINPGRSRIGTNDHGRGGWLLEFENRSGERPTHPRGRHTGRDNPARRRAVRIWSMLLIMMTLAVIAGALGVWLKPHLFHAAGERSDLIDAEIASERVPSKFPSPSREQSLDLVRKALAIRDPRQVQKIFRTGTASRSEIMDFFKCAEDRDGRVERLDWLSSVDVNGLLLEGVLVTCTGKEHPIQRLAFLTPDSAGNWKFDFDAYARPARPSWTDLLENHAQRSVVRVIVAKYFYFNGPYADDKVWNCYAMTSPDREEILYGYCRAGSHEASAMEVLLANGRTAARATLEILHPAGAESHQFQIGNVLAEDWVMPDSIVVVN